MKARVVLFPTPGAGHLVSMLQLAKRILHHAPSLSITILLIHPPLAATATNSHVNAAAASGLDIDFIEIPRSEPAEGEGLVHLLRFIETHKPCVRETLESLPGVAAFVADMFCITVMDAATELGIPAFIFYASSAACLAATLYLPTLNRRYEGRALKEVKENIQVPGMSPVPPTVIPGPLQDKDDPAHPWFLRTAGLYSRLDGVLVNTFHELEQKALTTLTDGLCTPGGRTTPIHPVGPLLGLDCAHNDGWECIEWFGVPMVTWPQFAEQAVNAFELVNGLGLGLRMVGEEVDAGTLVRGEELGRAVRALMEGEVGARAREKMKAMKESARRAVEEGRGSSYANLAAVVQQWIETVPH